jgi:transposase-like protein
MTMDLRSVYKRFPDHQSCIKFLEAIMWPTKPLCPYCNSEYVTSMKDSNRYHCNTCNTSFSVTVNTVFHKTKCDLQKWFYLIFLFLSSDKMPSYRDFAKDANVTKDTALRMTKKVKQYYINNIGVFEKISKSLTK